MHHVAAFPFSVEIAKQCGAYGNAYLFFAFIRRCWKIPEETNLFPPGPFSNPPSTSWPRCFWPYYIWAS